MGLLGNGRWVTPQDSDSFWILQASTEVELMTAGGFPTISSLWRSTSHTGQVSSCRGGLVRLSHNVRINIRLYSGVAYGGNRCETCWSLFKTDLVAVAGSLVYVPCVHRFGVTNRPVSIEFLSCSLVIVDYTSAHLVHRFTITSFYLR